MNAHRKIPLLVAAVFALLILGGCSDSGPQNPIETIDSTVVDSDNDGETGAVETDANQSVSADVMDQDSSDPEESDDTESDQEPDPATEVMAPDDTSADSATYQLRFVAEWSATTHPVNFPANPHFSGLVGAVHSEQVIFWEPGQPATAGVEVVAESGSKTQFLDEVAFAVNEGTATSAINGPGISTSPGEVTVEFEVTRDYPLISVLSMLAPSPDWIVGIDRLNLFQNGSFIQEQTIELALYDAGTDSGLSFTSGNIDTNPKEVIQRLTSDQADSDFSDGMPIVGRFTITRLP